MNIAICAIIPGSLSPNNILHGEPTRVQVTRTVMNVVTLEGSTDNVKDMWFKTRSSRAGMIGQLEQQKVITFGLEPPTGWMVGWPSTLGRGLDGWLRYSTDVVHFDFECKWETQEVLHHIGTVIVSLPLDRRDIGNMTIKGTGTIVNFKLFVISTHLALISTPPHFGKQC